MSYKGFEKFDMAIGTYSQYRALLRQGRDEMMRKPGFKIAHQESDYALVKVPGGQYVLMHMPSGMPLCSDRPLKKLREDAPHLMDRVVKDGDQEMRRVLKPGGTVEIGVPGKEYARIVVDRLNSAGFRNPRTKTKTFADGGTMHVVTARKLDRSEK